MYRILALFLCMALFPAVAATAQDASEGREMGLARNSSEDGQRGAKELSGMSIVGNDEAPKSLYIIPWKSSELGVEASLDTILNEGDVPVDRDVFKRQLDFHRVSTKK